MIVNNLIIVDTSVIAFQMSAQIDKAGLTETNAKVYAYMAAEWVNSLGWIPALQSTGKCVWAIDSKPYWRNQLFPDYKAGRKPKPASFHTAMEGILSSSASLIDIKSQEADDVAAAIVRLWLDSSSGLIDQIYLATVDSDWHGLVQNPDIFWLNTRNHPPRVRSREEIFNWLCSKWNQQSKKRQKWWALPSYQSFRCDDVWRWKIAVGDKADNLSDGSAKYLIDLLRPPKQFDILESKESVNTIYRGVNLASKPDLSLAHECKQGMLSLGALPPIEMISLKVLVS